jgi:hypothetical protein
MALVWVLERCWVNSDAMIKKRCSIVECAFWTAELKLNRLWLQIRKNGELQSRLRARHKRVEWIFGTDESIVEVHEIPSLKWCDSVWISLLALAIFEGIERVFVHGMLLFETKSPIDREIAKLKGKWSRTNWGEVGIFLSAIDQNWRLIETSVRLFESNYPPMRPTRGLTTV